MGQRIFTTPVQHNQYETVIPSRTLSYCHINFLLDRCSAGPAIPGVVSHESGDYRNYNSPFRPAGVLSAGAPGMLISPKLGPTDTPGVTRLLPTSAVRILPNCSPCAFTHQPHVYKYVWAFTVPLFYTSGLSPYRCSRCPGFHRTAVLLLTEQYTTRDPLLYIASHNTLYLLYKRHNTTSVNHIPAF